MRKKTRRGLQGFIFYIKLKPSGVHLPSVWEWILLNLTSETLEQEINLYSNSENGLVDL